MEDCVCYLDIQTTAVFFALCDGFFYPRGLCLRFTCYFHAVGYRLNVLHPIFVLYVAGYLSMRIVYCSVFFSLDNYCSCSFLYCSCIWIYDRCFHTCSYVSVVTVFVIVLSVVVCSLASILVSACTALVWISVSGLITICSAYSMVVRCGDPCMFYCEWFDIADCQQTSFNF